jgi:hypothetical protein
MYRVRVPGADAVAAGDALYSPQFGADQASGHILYGVAIADGIHEALAVLQTAAAEDGTVHFKSLGGPMVTLLSLPYAVSS